MGHSKDGCATRLVLGLEIRAMGTTSRLLSCVQTPTVVVSGGWLVRARLGNWTRRVLNPVPTQIATNWTAATVQSLPENLKTTTTTPTTTWQAKGCKKKKTLLWDFWLLESNKLLRKVLVGCSSHASPGPFNVSRDVSPNPINKIIIKKPTEAHPDDRWAQT